ncbi:MAG TPA: hypothetical protein PK813_05110 [Candidatus Hydrogenedens sp.]|nr:hypothetical protein [Candidatus Hydrogenedens sp.]
MKFNSPWKALLWEELYVGGSIVSVVLGSCILISLLQRIFVSLPFIHWQDVDLLCYIVVYVTSFLLLLQIGNSGEMHIGFPRRILTLPVTPYLLVSVSLLTRFILIIAVTVLCRVVLGYGLLLNTPWNVSTFNDFYYYGDFSKKIPFEVLFYVHLIYPCFIHGIVYLTVQFLCWLFIFFPVLTGLLGLVFTCAGITLFIINYRVLFDVLSLFVGYVPFTNSFYETIIVMPTFYFILFIILSIIYFLIIWFLSIKIVSRIRSGVREQLETLIPSRLIGVLTWANPELFIKRFPNARIAQIWFELKDTGFIIPRWTFIFWGFLSIFYGLILFTVMYVGKNFRPFYFGYPDFVFLIFPLIALLLAGVVWYLKVSRPMKRKFKEGVFQLSQLPLTRKERSYVHLLAGNINLFIILPIIWLITFIYLYIVIKTHVFPTHLILGMDTFISQMPFSNMTYFTFPLIVFVTGLVLLSGVIVWLIMFNPSSILIILLAIFCCLLLNVRIIYEIVQNLWFVLGIESWVPSCPSSSCDFTYYVYPIIFQIIYYSFIAIFFIYYYIAFRNRLLGKREKVIVPSIFFGIFLCVMPWYLLRRENLSLLISTYLFLSSLFAGAWLRILLYSHGFHWTFNFKNLIRNIERKVGKEEELVSFLLIGYILPFAVVLLISLTYIGPNINKKCIAYFKENSLPISLKEIDKQYHSLPDDQNLAKKYFDLIPLCNEVSVEGAKYEEEFYKRINNKIKTEEEKEYLKKILYDSYHALLKNEKPMPEIVYLMYKDIDQKIYKKLTDKLHETAESGLTQGHYPIKLTQGYSTELPHLQFLRDYTNKLGLEAMLSAIDGDYENMLRAFRTCASIYNSLENEPVLISQLVRISIFWIIYGDIEWIFNHKELPEDVLIKLNGIIQTFAIPSEKRSMFKSSMHSELLMVLSEISIYQKERFMSHINYWASSRKYIYYKNIVRPWLPVIDTFYPADIETLIVVNLYTMLKKVLTDVAREENSNLPERTLLNTYSSNLMDTEKPIFQTSSPYWMFFTLFIVYPALERCPDSELRHYVYINLVQTGIAIERYRLRNNRLPDNLQELVPDYLPTIPKDPYRTGKPITYIKEDDFAYKIYSIGMDKEDDGGISKDVKKGIRNINEGDYVFSILPLSIRQQPDVSPDISLVSYVEE